MGNTMASNDPSLKMSLAQLVGHAPCGALTAIFCLTLALMFVGIFVVKVFEVRWGGFAAESMHILSLHTDVSFTVFDVFTRFFRVGYNVQKVDVVLIFVGICLMLTSAFTWAVVVANFVAIITHMNQEDADHERSMDTLTDLLDECKAPRLLRKELRGYFETVRQADVGIKRAQDLCARLSPGLRIFAVDALHSYWLQKVFWLKNINMCPLHVDVAQAVISEFFAPKERLEWAREMLVIRRGVGIWNSAYAVGRGTVLGADMMVESDHLREPCRLFALTYLEILRMDLTTFNDIVALHPTIAKHVRAAVCWHIVRKGIIKYALKMALEEKDDESDEDLRTQRSGMIKRHLTSKKTAMLTVDDDKYIPLAETEHKHTHDESLIEMKKDIAEIHKMLSSMSPGSGHTLDRHVHARTYERDEADAAAAESYLALRAGRVLTSS